MLRIHGNKIRQNKLSRMSWSGAVGVASCCALTLVFGFMLFPILPQEIYAIESEMEPGITALTDNSVGISVPTSIDFADVMPTVEGATTTATANVNVTTSNSASYKLYLYAADGNNSLRPKSSANISSINAIAGDVGLTLSSLEPNTWGYNLGTSAPTDATTYSAVPTNNSTPIQTKDTSDTNSANDTYTLSFGAKVDTTIASGAYSNMLTFAVVAEPAMVTVAFNGNGSTSGSMSSIRVPAGGSQVLPSNTFARTGYDFTGWNTNAGGTGTSYADGASYTAPTGSAGQTITLYAQWDFSANTMQRFTTAECREQADMGGRVSLIDARNGKSYDVSFINEWVYTDYGNGNVVVRPSDNGVCMMVANLSLEGGRTLTPSDSNVSSNWYFPDYSYKVLGSSYTEPRLYISDDLYPYYSEYNICAASAGTVCDDTPSVTATQDICPVGWHLPSRSEWESILNAPDEDSRETVLRWMYLNDNGTWMTANVSSDHVNFPQPPVYLITTSGNTMLGNRDTMLNVRCILNR